MNVSALVMSALLRKLRLLVRKLLEHPKTFKLNALLSVRHFVNGLLQYEGCLDDASSLPKI